MENFTASAFRGVPSWNFTPLRSLKVYWRPSFDMVQDSARPGTICVLSSGKVTSVSTTRRPTRFELRSVTWAGSRLTGSATSPTRSVPAGWAATPAAHTPTASTARSIEVRMRRAVMASLRAGSGANARHHTPRPHLAQARGASRIGSERPAIALHHERAQVAGGRHDLSETPARTLRRIVEARREGARGPLVE